MYEEHNINNKFDANNQILRSQLLLKQLKYFTDSPIILSGRV